MRTILRACALAVLLAQALGYAGRLVQNAYDLMPGSVVVSIIAIGVGLLASLGRKPKAKP